MIYLDSNLLDISNIYSTKNVLAILTVAQCVFVIICCLATIVFEVRIWYLSRDAQIKLERLASRSKNKGAWKTAMTGQLKKALKVYQLHSWSSRATDKNLAKRYFDLDRWLSPICGDDSPHSIYDHHPKADMYRALVEHFPYLIDFAAHAPPGLVRSFRRVLYFMEEVPGVVSRQGLCAQHVSPAARSSVFYWLIMWATPEQQQVFAEILQGIHNCQTNARDCNDCNSTNWSAVIRQTMNLDFRLPKIRRRYPMQKLKVVLQTPDQNIDDVIGGKEKQLKKSASIRLFRQL